jgi:hypothetical protein
LWLFAVETGVVPAAWARWWCESDMDGGEREFFPKWHKTVLSSKRKIDLY